MLFELSAMTEEGAQTDQEVCLLGKLLHSPDSPASFILSSLYTNVPLSELYVLNVVDFTWTVTIDIIL